jgi:hypothetical protein
MNMHCVPVTSSAAGRAGTGMPHPNRSVTRAVLLLLSWAALTGCDVRVTYRFKVVNATQNSIQVDYTTAHTSDAILLETGQEAFIYEEQRANSGIVPYFKENETIWWFDTLEAVRGDFARANKDLREARWWRFYEHDGQGIYELALEDSDFQ